MSLILNQGFEEHESNNVEYIQFLNKYTEIEKF